MTSPVITEGQGFFSLPNKQPLRFFSLGQQKGNKGIVHSVFFSRTPVHNSFYVGDAFQASGYLSYRLLFNSSCDLLVGVVFFSLSHLTMCSDNQLFSGNFTDVPEDFEPLFSLEKLELLMYRASDSSVLVIPKTVSSSLLITVDHT